MLLLLLNENCLNSLLKFQIVAFDHLLCFKSRVKFLPKVKDSFRVCVEKRIKCERGQKYLLRKRATGRRRKKLVANHLNQQFPNIIKHSIINNERYFSRHQSFEKGEVNLGTSIMAVTFKDGVILGADSRTTTGSYIANRVTDKLTQIHDTIYCCRSGSAADTQAVADMVKYYLQIYSSQLPPGETPTTNIAANVFQEICYNNKDNLTAGIICAGYDRKMVDQFIQFQ